MNNRVIGQLSEGTTVDFAYPLDAGGFSIISVEPKQVVSVLKLYTDKAEKHIPDPKAEGQPI